MHDNNKNITEILYGKEFSDRKEALEKDLLEIEDKNNDWFKDRKDNSGNVDRLYMHYIMKWESNQIDFRFLDTSDLPKHIQQECMIAFEKHFS